VLDFPKQYSHAGKKGGRYLGNKLSQAMPMPSSLLVVGSAMKKLIITKLLQSVGHIYIKVFFYKAWVPPHTWHI